MNRVRIDLYQNGHMVASADGPEEQAVTEIRRYTLQYVADGPVELRVKRGKVDLRSIFLGRPGREGGT